MAGGGSPGLGDIVSKQKFGDELLEIEIVNWGKHNPKRAQRTYSWLRLNNDIAADPKLFGLTAAQRYAFILLLCEASKKNTGLVQVRIDFLAHIACVTGEEVESLLNHLIGSEIIRVLNAGSLHQTTPKVSKRARRTTPTRRDETRRDETDETKSTSVSESGSPGEGGIHPLADLWNEIAHADLPRVSGIRKGSSRDRATGERWDERPDLEHWRVVITRLNQSSFLTGRTEGARWKADFDWIMKPDSATKVLEGKYDDAKGGPARGRGPTQGHQRDDNPDNIIQGILGVQ
jgi:hypothetical protein